MQIKGKWTGKLFTYHDSRQIFVPEQGWKMEFLIDPSPGGFWVWAPAEDFEPVPEHVADTLKAAVAAGKEVLDRLVAVLNVDTESESITGVSSQGHIQWRKCGYSYIEGSHGGCNMDARWVVGCMRHDNPVYPCSLHLHTMLIEKEREQPGDSLYVRSTRSLYQDREY